MSPELFEIIRLILLMILIVITSFVAPAFKRWIEQNMTKDQRKDALFWIKMITRVAEDIFKEKGSGALKKKYVLEWLDKNGIKLMEEQTSILIDMVVEAYNKNGWDKVLEDQSFVLDATLS